MIAYGNGRKRSAVVVNNIHAVAIKQVSDENATLIEISYGLIFYAASSYFAIDRDTEGEI